MNTIDNNMTRLGGFAGLDMGTIPAAAEQLKETGSDRGLTIGTASPSALDALDEVDPAVEAALTRDDELGDLMGRVFNLPAPPMPDLS